MKFRTDHGAKHVADTQNTADVHTQTSHSFIGCSNTAQAIVALNKRISIYTLTGARVVLELIKSTEYWIVPASIQNPPRRNKPARIPQQTTPRRMLCQHSVQAQDSTTELIINSIMIRAFADNVYGSNRAITVYLPDVSQFSVPFYTNL